MSLLASTGVAALFDALKNDDRPVDISFMFQVLTNDGPIGDFQQIENLTRQVQMHEYWEGGKNDAAHVLIGPVKQGEVTLKWGHVNLSYLFAWSNAVEIGGDFRRDVIIMQLTRAGLPLRVYLLEKAWPIEWKGANLDSSQSQIPIEEVRIAHNGLYMEILDV